MLAAALAGCGIVAGLGDAPLYVETTDGSAGVSGASATGTGGSTNQPDGSVASAGGSVGASGNDLGRGGDVMTVCAFNCPEAATTQIEASVISVCRGAICPNDGGVVTPEAGPCTSPSSCLVLPDGWQPVALTSSACPSGFNNPQTFYTSAKGDPYTCSCGCAGTQTCSGTATLNEYSDEAGAGCMGTPSTRPIAFSPTCLASNFGNVLTGNSYTLSNVVYGPGPACSSAPTATTKPQASTASTRVCSANAICPSGVCLSAADAASLCIEKAGTNMCPGAEYPNRSLMSLQVDDSRGCDVCTCGSSLTCTLLGVVLDNDSNCAMGHPYEMTANIASCAPAPSNFPLNATVAQHKVSGTPACAEVSPSMPTGKVGLNDATTITVCCK